MRMAASTILFAAIGIPGFAGTIYTNGPETGMNAFVIGGIYSISDGFVATDSGTAASFDFGFADPTGATPVSVTWALGTTPFASDISQGTSLVTSVYLFTVLGAEDYFDATVQGVSGTFVAGNTYYLTLSNATDSVGYTVDGWQINGGPATCYGGQNGVNLGPCGPIIGSESFTISGTTIPEPSTVTLLGGGLLAMAGFVRQKSRRIAQAHALARLPSCL